MSTTNGTRAILLGAAGARCLIASFLNARAVAEALREAEDDILILAAGREGRFALEDAICAGMIARAVRRTTARRLDTNDAAKAAMLLAARFGRSLGAVLPRTAAGRRLASLGRSDEIDFCASVDRYDQVPRVQDRRITL